MGSEKIRLNLYIVKVEDWDQVSMDNTSEVLVVAENKKEATLLAIAESLCSNALVKGVIVTRVGLARKNFEKGKLMENYTGY